MGQNKRCCTNDAAFLSATSKLTFSLLFLLLVLFSGVSQAGDTSSVPNIIHQHSLLPGLQCFLATDGTFVLSLGDAEYASSQIVLEGGVVPARRSRRANPSTMRSPFYSVVRQGVSGGRRGFSAMADDDSDGLTDEDRLDGLDNDGDGSVDEDYAAIADAMVVVDVHDGHQGNHLEFYHWAYPQLQSSVFIDVSVRNALDEPASGWWRFDLPETQWREVEVSSLHHGSSGRQESLTTMAFVAEIPDILESGSLWLGTVILDKQAQNMAGKLGQRVRLEKGTLDIPSGESSMPMVLCAAPSWLQLSRALSEAQRVYNGTTDPVSGFHVPWIVPPGCISCRRSTVPEAEWEAQGDKGLRLAFQVDEGNNTNFDPDMFSVHGIHVGSPESITWNTNKLPFSSRVWKLATLGLVCQDPSSVNNPYASFPGLDGHSGVGILGFEFLDIPAELRSLLDNNEGREDGKLALQGLYLDGRSFSLLIEPVEVKSGLELLSTVADPQESVKNDILTLDQLSLSATLLDGYPNPFKDAITMRFSIPQTMESAFTVPEDEQWPSDLEKSAPVPWEGGSPSVSVKIYNINGQELRTLHEGNHLNGEFTVGWDGSDAFGRKVASGTYFCKLQLDKWSVTRRVVFLR